MSGERPTARRAPLLAALVCLTWIAGCGERAADGPPPNLLLITLDTTRADRLGAYGHDGAITPNLDGLAERGIVFDRAAAVAPVTLPSHASIMTGLYPPSHGALDNVDYTLAQGIPTLAEHLLERGYATAAAVAAYVLAPGTGLDRGFQVYNAPDPAAAIGSGNELTVEPIVERDAHNMTNLALSMLKGPPDEPWFLWLHYFDPHADYTPPEPWASRTDDAYDGEIAFSDAQLGRVLTLLRVQGRLENTLIVVTADHGESLGEHGEKTHGLFAYESTIHVPLIVVPPVPRAWRGRSDRLVSGVDLAPTILELLGQPPMEGVQGVSFAPTIRGETQRQRGPIYAESRLPELAYGWSSLRVLRDGDLKLIDAPRPELYDLATDPAESSDLATGRPDDTQDALRALVGLHGAMPAPPEPTFDPADDERRERLASLGYLSSGGGGGASTVPASADDVDPKDRVSLHNALLDAEMLSGAGRHDDALALAADVVRRDPDNPAALSLHGTLLCRAGRCDEGLARLIAAAEAQPRDYDTLHNLANAFDLAGRPREALATFQAAIALRPDAAADRFGVGTLLYRAGDLDGAIAAFSAALERGMDTARLHAALGIALSKTPRTDEAVASLVRALDADPTQLDAWNALGILSEKGGKPDEAHRYYDRALQVDGRHADSLFNMARLSLQSSRLDDAEEAIGRLMADRPDYPAARFIDAQIALALGDRERARRSLQRFLEGPPPPDPRLIEPARSQLAGLGGG